MKFNITYRRTSRISMRIGKNLDIRISAPYGTTKEELKSFVERHREWIETTLKKISESNLKRKSFYSRLPLNTAAEKREATRRMDEIVLPMIDKYSKLLNVKAKSITYNNATTRWGSCNKSIGSINLSVYVLLLPTHCIEHVVAHELTHLIEANHSKRFYEKLETVFPNWREARKETKRITQQQSTDTP